ncbi:VWA domain-containing protein [Candidatus Woesearchaeota archaeon]|nr:VWA domain-containing protein [Candidatus Woesearchaeota archaeon]
MAFIFPDLSNVFCMSKFCFRYSYAALFIIPFTIILYFAVKKNFISFFNKTEQAGYEKEKKNQRLAFFLIRSLVFALVLIAIASPFIMETRTVKGNPRITILTDNSTSLNLFEEGIDKELVNKLKSHIPVAVRHIATGDKSAIGDGILNNLERDENVLVITDGNSNDGKLLGDVMLLASSLNTTVSTLSMEPVRSDVGVEIEGPYEAIRDTEEVFLVHVNSVGGNVPYTLEVRFDDEIVIARTGEKSGTFTLNRKLSEGYHKITAELLNVGEEDYFKQNNKYYKAVKVVPRPRVLFVSEKNSPLVSELEEIYDLTTTSTVPDDLSSYLAVILNDIPAGKFLPHMDSLSDYVSDGNGLFVVGGQSSYDKGGYKGTMIETLLPVKIGAGEESEKSDVYIVIVIDVSGTTGWVYNTNTGETELRPFADIIKAQAVSVIDSLNDKNNVGVIVIGVQPVGTVVKLSDITALEDKKEEIIDLISRISKNIGGQTEIRLGIQKADQMLRSVTGGKNVILLSDGRGIAERPKEEVKEAVRQANARGIKFYVAGVGASDEQDYTFLSDIAQLGGGVYFPVDASNKLKILFGEPEGKDEKEFLNKLVLLDTTHFITYNQSLDVVVSGYNYAIPKAASRLLITTNKNIPIMVAWRFGLGRVVSMATDDGSKWGGEFLSSENSKILTKAINWVIGDLSRKKNFDVSIRDATLDDVMLVNVVSDSLPSHEQLSFVKSDVNFYTAKFNPARTGFYNFLGADAAVNYKDEFKDLGVNDEFIKLVEQTQGKVFVRDDIGGILEFVKEKSKRIKVDTAEFKWPFLLVALVLFLAEIGLRRLWENRSYR